MNPQTVVPPQTPQQTFGILSLSSIDLRNTSALQLKEGGVVLKTPGQSVTITHDDCERGGVLIEDENSQSFFVTRLVLLTLDGRRLIGTINPAGILFADANLGCVERISIEENFPFSANIGIPGLYNRQNSCTAIVGFGEVVGE